jgi:transcriptional regulator with XRE-family HTH domain
VNVIVAAVVNNYRHTIIIATTPNVNDNCSPVTREGEPMGRRRISETDRTFRTEVARKFREAMKARGLNQTQAAKELNITRQAVSQYLLEKTTPQGEILARVCARWDLSLRYRATEFKRGAFGAQETTTEPEVLQMDLFREPQVFENAHLIVTVQRSQKAALQVTIRMKKAGLTVPSSAKSKTGLKRALTSRP